MHVRHPARIFNSFDPTSLAEILAYHKLYPSHTQSVERALSLLHTTSEESVRQNGAALNSSTDALSEAQIGVIEQLASQPDAYAQARRYSAMLDLMALQILAKLPEEASHCCAQWPE